MINDVFISFGGFKLTKFKIKISTVKVAYERLEIFFLKNFILQLSCFNIGQPGTPGAAAPPGGIKSELTDDDPASALLNDIKREQNGQLDNSLGKEG